MVLKRIVQKENSKQSLPEVISNQIIKNKLSHTWLDQINVYKYGICFCGKLATKLLALAANKNTNFLFTKTGRLVSEMTVWKNSKQRLP